MTNKKFLERASKLQKEYAELYKHGELAGIDNNHILVTQKLFRECEREGLLEHISETLTRGDDYFRLKAMTLDGVEIIALEDRDKRRGK